MKYTNMS